MASLVAQMVKNQPAMVIAGCIADSSTPRSGRSSGEGDGYPLQYPCLDRGALAGYGTWGRKEMDTTDGLTHIHA